MRQFFFFIFCLLVGCVPKSEKFFCDKLDLSNAMLGDVSFVSHYPDILDEIGNSPIIKDSCSSTSILYKQGYHYYNCLEFDNIPGIVFKQIKDTIFVAHIDFKDIQVPVVINGKVLNENTTIDDLVKGCSFLKERINKGVSSAVFDNMDWIYITESEDNRRIGRKNQIELRFHKSKLVSLEYNWQPMYSKEEWINYLKVKNELKLRK